MSIEVDVDGFYGPFGGAFIPEMLQPNIKLLKDNYLKILNASDFINEYNGLLKNYAGRPSPLYFASRLSDFYNTNIYLKREDLLHTGSHKINNTIGQALLAKRLKKTRIIAETGAGQHGVATATVCALMGMECTVYMGAVDMQRQEPNVKRMQMLGAKVIPVNTGSRTLKDAINEAIRDWINNAELTHYIIGSVVGPHPYPDLVARLQSVISDEISGQIKLQTKKEYPDYVIACVGGGSNAIGAFYNFIGIKDIKLIGAEAAGKGVNSGETAAAFASGSPGIIHGSKTYLMQTDEGQIIEPFSISAGLDYPGVGPVHSYLYENKLADYLPVTDDEALNAAFKLAKLEGIVPALESAHALAVLDKIKFKKSDVVVINLSGRGDKDMDTYMNYKLL